MPQPPAPRQPNPINPPRRTKTRATQGGGNTPGGPNGNEILLLPNLYLDSNYTTNLCTNPSFETDLTGWTTTDSGTSITQSVTLTNAAGQVVGQSVALYGGSSMQVNTDGTSYNQGVIGPAGTVPANTGPVIGSMLVSLFGEDGTLTVTAAGNPGGRTLSSTEVVLNGTWQTIELNNLLFPAASGGGTVYLIVTTSNSQAIQFNVDGVMYQPTSPVHQYVDGDQTGCAWTGTAEESTSFQKYQWTIATTPVVFKFSGDANLLASGEIFQAQFSTLEFKITPSLVTQFGVVNPTVALTDFGIWNLTDPDPAQTYVWWTNSGTTSGGLTGGTPYTRIYGMFAPPIDYQVSGGNYAWKRAAYGAVGFQWNSVPSGDYQVLSDVQLEMAPTSVGSATLPSTYQRPRQLQVVIRPNRLNYITNPSMYASTANWSGIHGDETLAVSNQIFPGQIENFNNLPASINQSLKITLTSSSSVGAQISVPNLIPGETYMCSFYCYPDNGLGDILGAAGTGAGDVAKLINSADGYGVPPYGTGPYGGVNAATQALAQVWTRVSFPLISTTDTATLLITVQPLTGTTVFPVSVFVTGVLLELGDILQPYFDGYSGADALWEYTGGTTTPVAGGGALPGTSRSYYYNQLEFGQAIVTQTLESNTPLGISTAVPLYGTPPLQ